MSVRQAALLQDLHNHDDAPPLGEGVGEAVGEAVGSRGVEGLSNDYLNHFSEVLMLVELAAVDPEVIADLAEWRPIDYPSYFATSQLRRAPEARAAYEALCAERLAAFEQVVRAMDQLSTTAIRALRPPLRARRRRPRRGSHLPRASPADRAGERIPQFRRARSA